MSNVCTLAYSLIKVYNIQHMDERSRLILTLEENRRLIEENQLKSDFLSLIVHQLRTPLVATKWIFKMIMDGDLGNISKEQRGIIEKGFESNERMIKMLAEVSYAIHTNEWELKFNLVPVDVTHCIESTVSAFTNEAETKQLQLLFKKPDFIPLVMADKEKIYLVIQNLIENAIKYSKENSVITIHLELFKNNLVVSVTDTGIGIPENVQKHIFKKFFRATNASKKESGTGLGLFISKQIIEGHRGTIWFESTENIGTTFFFSLPLVKNEQK